MPGIAKPPVLGDMAMPTHSQRAAYALQKLAEEDPALGALALWCGHQDGDGNDDRTAWTAGETIHYGPRFSDLAPHEQVGLAAHHVLHVAFQHSSRSNAMRMRLGEEFHADIYNSTADAIVNETLLKAGFALPRPAITVTSLISDLRVEQTTREKALTCLDADALYILLVHDRSGSSDHQSSSRDTAGRAARVRAAAEQMGFYSDLEDDPSTAPDPSGSTQEAEWSQRLAFAMEQGRQSGRGIGALGLRLEDLPKVTTPWEGVLRRLVTKSLNQDRLLDYRRPARRWLALESSARRAQTDQPAFVPATRQDQDLPRIVVGLDTSGSIDAPRLKNFAAQVAALARRSRAELHVLVFDEELRSRAVLNGPDVVQQITALPFTRDGGTSFVHVIEEAVALDPSILVILTDLDGPFGALVPSCPVIWAVPGEAASKPSDPPYGRILSLAT
ncbi:MAG: VWA-like domain-containing protein [Pseudomonadota bacterium]